MMRLLCVALIAGSVLSAPAAGQQNTAANNEEFARRQFESGMNFLRSGRDTEALKDLQAVVDSFSASSVADNALLQIAQYQLETAHALDDAQETVDRLLKEYPDADSAPMAHVVSGRIAVTRGRSQADVDAALASFERVPRLFPGNDAVAAAGFYAGETLRSVRRDPEALERYRRVTMQYPHSMWAARARLSVGYCLVQGGRTTDALKEFQLVRQQFPGSHEADTALGLISTAYRLYVRAPEQPAFAFVERPFGPERSDYRNVVGVRFTDSGQMMLGHRSGVTVFNPDGTVDRTIAAVGPSAFFVDDQGRVVVARRGTLVAGGGEAIAFAGPGADGQIRAVDDIPAALATARGERLISNPKGRNVLRSMPNGRFLSVFATGAISRMTQNWLGDVAMIDRSTKSIVIADQDGKPLSRIATKGNGYELGDPVDLAFDALGHLYVLDTDRSAIFVFGARNALITTLTIPDGSPGALGRASALAVDAMGRVYVFDTRSRRIQVYR